jgi:hypothetical protein
VNDVSESVRRHAALVSGEQLRRLDGRLSRLGADDRRAVDELARSVAFQVAETLLDEARRDARVARALESVYL